MHVTAASIGTAITYIIRNGAWQFPSTVHYPIAKQSLSEMVSLKT